ncbi:unnamed protein product [Acanthoscelides obtectus]|uniref:Uncharacterized protein n=1 Tax=Acanthoscelides obtectus TaxID=200917 RepID=A0A9P0PYI5_ACAOB|nr:unnamed protein product [Acanthoscelides obtectus]CAK1672708.1 hypothetical protein AOBTE_LOCUS29059 [Acanthoscelides obtectus]
METNSEGSDTFDDYDSDKDAEYKPHKKESRKHIRKVGNTSEKENKSTFGEEQNKHTMKSSMKQPVEHSLGLLAEHPVEHTMVCFLEHCLEHPDEYPKEASVEPSVERPMGRHVESPVEHPIESEDLVEHQTEKKVSRKRTRDPKSWAHNIRKEKYDRGMEYVSSRKKLRPARKIVTKKDCLNRCHFKCATKLTEDDRKDIFSNYYKLDANEKRMFILNTTIKCKR